MRDLEKKRRRRRCNQNEGAQKRPMRGVVQSSLAAKPRIQGWSETMFRVLRACLAASVLVTATAILSDSSTPQLECQTGVDFRPMTIRILSSSLRTPHICIIEETVRRVILIVLVMIIANKPK